MSRKKRKKKKKTIDKKKKKRVTQLRYGLLKNLGNEGLIKPAQKLEKLVLYHLAIAT